MKYIFIYILDRLFNIAQENATQSAKQMYRLKVVYTFGVIITTT